MHPCTGWQAFRTVACVLMSWTKLVSVLYRPGLRGYSIYSKVVYIPEDGQVLMEFLKNEIFSLFVYDP